MAVIHIHYDGPPESAEPVEVEIALPPTAPDSKTEPTDDVPSSAIEPKTPKGAPEEASDSGGVSVQREFATRLDVARTAVNQTFSRNENLEGLLDQALGLLEAISDHPVIRDFDAQQRRVDNLEQRLGYGAYPQ